MVDGRTAPRGVRRGPPAGAHRRRRHRRPTLGRRHGPTRRGHDRGVRRARTRLGGTNQRRVGRGHDRRRPGVRHRAPSLRRAVRVRRPHRPRPPRRRRRGAVERRITQPLARGRRAARPRRRRRRDRRPMGRVPHRGGARRAAPGQRPADLGVRRQPPRPPPRPRQGRDGRRHARRPGGDARPQHHRGAYQPLPERFGVLRPVRRAGDVRDRRGEHRGARLQHQPVRRRPLPRRVAGAWVADGAARPQPPVRDRLEPGQRERLRGQPHRARRVDPPRRPHPAAALRGRRRPRRLGRRPRGDRHRLPDVPDHRGALPRTAATDR